MPLSPDERQPRCDLYRSFDPATARMYADKGAAFLLVGADVALLARGSEALAAAWTASDHDADRASY